MDVNSGFFALSASTGDPSATQRSYLALRRMIVTGELKPGEKLKIEELRSRLEIGASPIREALSLLTSDSLVERIDQRGFRAAPISQSNFEEILALRCELENMALRQSIARRNQEWEEAVVISHHRMVRAGANDDPAFEDLHKEFHMALLRNCDAPILKKFCSQLYDLNIRYRYLASKSSHYKRRDVSNEHSELVEYAIAGDAEKSAEALVSHYHKTGAFLGELFAE